MLKRDLIWMVATIGVAVVFGQLGRIGAINSQRESNQAIWNYYDAEIERLETKVFGREEWQHEQYPSSDNTLRGRIQALHLQVFQESN